MPLISVNVENSDLEQKNKLGMTWKGVIKLGLNAISQNKAQAALVEDYRKLQERQARTAELLQRAIRGENVLE